MCIESFNTVFLENGLITHLINNYDCESDSKLLKKVNKKVNI